jgi:hypothetical protein
MTERQKRLECVAGMKASQGISFLDGRGIAMTEKSKQAEALDGIDERRRRILMRLGLGAAFVTPIVASFSIDGLTISKVHAQLAPNSSGFVSKPKPAG